jgi:hypothetical protein
MQIKRAMQKDNNDKINSRSAKKRNPSPTALSELQPLISWLIIIQIEKNNFFILSRLYGMDEDKKPSHATVPLKKCSNRLIFHTFWLVVCKLTKIRNRFPIQLITLMRIRIFI